MLVVAQTADVGHKILTRQDPAADAAAGSGSDYAPLFGPPALVADYDEMLRFAGAVFKRCGGVEGWIALRAFEHDGDGRAVENQWAPLGKGLVSLAAKIATSVANRSFERRAVFSPPVCVFGDMMLKRENGSEYRSASAANVVCAPVVAVELDERPAESLAALQDVLGEATVIVSSGGRWAGPDGVEEDKLHAYWRLGTPAVTPEDQAMLYRARDAATRLVGGDGTAVSLVHPMRWPGSWHTKNEEARLCRIVGGNPDRNVKLSWALEELEAALLKARLDAGGSVALERGARRGFKTKREWGEQALTYAAGLIPNTGLTWDQWNTLGMAFWDASHASAAGLEAFHVWSERDPRYDRDVTDARWSHWSSSPPSNLSGGTLVYEMKKVDPGYRLHLDVAELFQEPGPEAADTAGDEAGDASVPRFISELNRRHAFVMNKGQSFVANLHDNGEVDFSRRGHFLDLYANTTERIGKKEQSKAEWWWEHPRRCQYVRGVDFDPDGTPPGVFNLWRGFPPLSGGEGAGEEGCELILRHIREVICDGDVPSVRYLLGWLAHILQNPGEKPGVAVVLRGKKGAGKDTLGEILEAILGHLTIMVASQNQVTGDFNAHLSGKLLLHVEEAIWAGSKQAESILKSLITAPTISVQPKGVDIFKAKNRMRILMTSNENWVVPATEDERRYFVLNVSDAHRHDAAWFDPLRAEIEGRGPACFARFLRQYPLKGFDVRRPPDTRALLDQKLISLPTVEQWLYERLRDETLGMGGWPEEIACSELFRLYQRETEKARFPRPVGQAQFGQIVQRVLRTGPPIRRRAGDERQRVYSLPNLADARDNFSAFLGAAIDWNN